jgi:hypothetical protein
MRKPRRTCNFPCISSHPNLTADYTDNADLHGSRSRKSALISGEFPGFPISRDVGDPGDVGDLAAPTPSRIIPPHPNSSKIGVDLRGLAFPISRDVGDYGDVGDFHGPLPASFSQRPHPLFFNFCCKQSTFVNRRLGLPCATLGWPLGHPWATQGPPNPKPNPKQRVASRFKYQIPSTKYRSLANGQQLAARSFCCQRS